MGVQDIRGSWRWARAAALVPLWLGGSALIMLAGGAPLPVLLLTGAMLSVTFAVVQLVQPSSGLLLPLRVRNLLHLDVSSGHAAEAHHFLGREFAAARRGRNVTLVMFAFSAFDEFVEAEGSRAATDAIHEFGAVLDRMTRRMNLSARCGWRADSFLSVLSNADADAAQVFIGRVREAASDARVPMPAIEAGVAVFQPHYQDPADFVAAAERALAAARAEAFNRPPAAGMRSRQGTVVRQLRRVSVI
jgi:GGDEF domain-containing protein